MVYTRMEKTRMRDTRKRLKNGLTPRRQLYRIAAAVDAGRNPHGDRAGPAEISTPPPLVSRTSQSG